MKAPASLSSYSSRLTPSPTTSSSSHTMLFIPPCFRSCWSFSVSYPPCVPTALPPNTGQILVCPLDDPILGVVTIPHSVVLGMALPVPPPLDCILVGGGALGSFSGPSDQYCAHLCESISHGDLNNQLRKAKALPLTRRTLPRRPHSKGFQKVGSGC